MAKNEKPTTKICKHCKTEIPYDAKVCPNCRRKVKGGKLKWILIALVLVIIIAAAAGGSNDTDTKKVGEVAASSGSAAENEAVTSETAADEEQQEEPVQTVYHVGDILQDGNLEIVYMSSGEHVEENEFMQPADGKKYIYIQLAFENTSDKSDAAVSMYSFEGYADGYSVDMYYGGEDTLSSTLSAGRSVSGYLYFEVPEDAQNIEIEYEPNFITQEKLTFVYEGDKDSGYEIEPDTTATEGALKAGETYDSDTLKITYLQCFADTSDNQFEQPKDGCHYVTCEFEFENLSDSDKAISMYSFDCFADGIACDQAYFRDDTLNATLSSGRKVKGTVTFEVPDGSSTVEVEYLDNVWTSDRITFSADA